MQRFLGVLLLLVLVPLSAIADGPPARGRVGAPYQEPVTGAPWTGFYVGAGIGTYTGIVEIDKVEVDLGNWGFLGDVRAGYDYQFPGGTLVVGAFGGYSFGEAEADIGGIEASLTPTWNLGARLGVAFDRSLIYAGYKISQAEVAIQGVEDRTVTGHSVLGGVELMAFKPMSVQLEYAYTMYDSVAVGPLEVDPSAHSVMLRGVYRLPVVSW